MSNANGQTSVNWTALNSAIRKVFEADASVQHLVVIWIDSLGQEVAKRELARYSLFIEAQTKRKWLVGRSSTPATTTNSVVALYSGQTPLGTGILEWTVFDSDLERYIDVLPFRLKSEPRALRDSLCGLGFSPSNLLPSGTTFSELTRQGVECKLIQPTTCAAGAFTTHVCGSGIQHVTYHEMSDAMAQVQQAVRSDRRTLTFAYYDQYDSAAHATGPSSPEALKVLHSIMGEINSFWSRNRSENAICLRLISDHGQVDVRNWVLLKDEMPQLAHLLRPNLAGGNPLSGGGRFTLLHLNDADNASQVAEALSTKLKGRADVALVDTLISEEFFGEGSPKPTARRLMGHIAVMALDGLACSWDQPRPEVGMHGGRSTSETETPYIELRSGQD